ncbi:MAG: hypothetical protein K1X75_02005 [Leptospirales bacterium]|nr:hypothetical protein [Leptospirales bacterium]
MEAEAAYRIFHGVFFQVFVPADWEQEIIENIPCFFDPDGAGALQLAATRRDAEEAFDPAEELRYYLEKNGVEYAEDRVALYHTPQGALAAACEYRRDGRFWMVQMIAEGRRMIVALYNADATPDEELARELSVILSSIRFSEEAARR